MTYIATKLAILVPVLNLLGQVIKNWLSSIGIRDGVTVPAIAKELLFAPISGNAPAGRSWMRNGANSERLVFAGGYWCHSSCAGLGCLYGTNERSNSISFIGARPARLICPSVVSVGYVPEFWSRIRSVSPAGAKTEHTS